MSKYGRSSQFENLRSILLREVEDLMDRVGGSRPAKEGPEGSEDHPRAFPYVPERGEFIEALRKAREALVDLEHDVDSFK